jgi:hypothetical protein
MGHTEADYSDWEVKRKSNQGKILRRFTGEMVWASKNKV